MTGFLLSVWNDLRAKRLWPVALALALALVAVPVVLLKPAKQAPPPAASPGKPSPAASRTPVSAAVDTGASSLDRFSSKNPFRGAPKQGAATAAAGATGAPAGSSSPASSPAGGSSGSTPSGGGSSGSTGGSEPTQAPPAPQSGSPTKTTKYTYVVDLSFGRDGHLRRHRGFGKLGILPNEDDPLLVFVGITDGGGNAAFLVDSTLIPQGEGRCKPSAKNCNFLYLGPGSEHRLTDTDGQVWTLRIDAIRKVSVKKARASKARARKANRVKAHTATGEPRAKRRFVPPLFVDLIETGGK